MYAPPLVNANVNPNALPVGGLVYVNVVLALTVLLKLFAVDKFNDIVPPVPNDE
jgi:hypothetical protein